MSLTEGYDLAEAHEHRMAELDRRRTPADYLAPVPDAAGAADEAAGGGWRVDDDRTASYAFRRIAESEAEVTRLKAAAEADIAAVRQWLDDATRPHRATIKHLTGALIDYRRRLEEAHPHLAKTYKLPGGDLTRRAGRTSLVVVDEDALMAWAERNAPEAIKREIRVSLLGGEKVDGRVVTAEGEVIPGLEVVAPDDVLGVKVRPEPSPVERVS